MSASTLASHLDRATGSSVTKANELTGAQQRVAGDILRLIGHLARHEKEIRKEEVRRDHNTGRCSDLIGRAIEAERLNALSRRPHRTIVLNGKRGTGKTTLLLTLHHWIDVLSRRGLEHSHGLIAGLPETENLGPWHDDGWGNALVLPAMFPALREAEGGLMEEIFGAIHHQLPDAIPTCGCNDGANDTLNDSLLKVWSGWVFGQHQGNEVLGRDSADFDDYVTQRAKAAATACQRQKLWADFVSQFLDAQKRELLVICVDDSDLKPHTAIEVADAIHQYLAHPRIVTILAADLDDFHRHILGHELEVQRQSFDVLAGNLGPYFLQDLRIRSTFPDQSPNMKYPDQILLLAQEGVKAATEQCREFLRKIMPLPQRYRLPSGVDIGTVEYILGFPATTQSGAKALPVNEGHLALWLLRHRYMTLLFRMKLRQLNQLRAWLDLRGFNLAEGRWDPAETMLSFVDDDEQRERLSGYFDAVAGRSRHRPTFDERGTWLMGLAGNRLEKSWHNAIVSAMADLHGLMGGNSLRSNADLVIKDPSESTRLIDALENAVSPLASTLPANAWYAADMAATTALVRARGLGGSKLDVLRPSLSIATPKRVRGFVGKLAATTLGLDRQETADVIFNAWLYWKRFPVGPQKGSAFILRLSEYKRELEAAIDASRSSGDQNLTFNRFLAFLGDLSSFITAAREREDNLADQLRMALQIALVPLAGEKARSIQAEVDNASLKDRLQRLHLVVTGESGDVITWRDRYMLALAAQQPLSDLLESSLAADVREQLRDTISGIRLFLTSPATEDMLGSALDIAHALGSWDELDQIRTKLDQKFAKIEGALAKAPSAPSAEAVWLGVSAAEIRKLRDAHPPQ